MSLPPAATATVAGLGHRAVCLLVASATATALTLLGLLVGGRFTAGFARRLPLGGVRLVGRLARVGLLGGGLFSLLGLLGLLGPLGLLGLLARRCVWCVGLGLGPLGLGVAVLGLGFGGALGLVLARLDAGLAQDLADEVGLGRARPSLDPHRLGDGGQLVALLAFQDGTLQGLRLNAHWLLTSSPCVAYFCCL